MTGTLCIRTDRLTLRPLTQADAPRLQEIAGVPEVAQMMASIPHPWTDAEVVTWITSSQWRGRIGFRLGIARKDGVLIGALGFGGDPLDIAYLLGPDFWGQGYATEAVGHFVHWLFQSFDLDEIQAEHMNDNPASGWFLLKLGFERLHERTCASAARVEAAPSTLYRVTQAQLKVPT